MKLYEAIAQCLGSIARIDAGAPCAAWARGMHIERLAKLCADHLPSGSGIDNGSKLSERSTPNRLIFSADFHHMNDAGMYAGWTSHEVIVTPDLGMRFNTRVTGRDRNGIKDYLADTFAHCINIDIDE